MANTPKGRRRNVTGESADLERRGEGLNSGPVGNAGGYEGRPGVSSKSGVKSGNTAPAGSRSVPGQNSNPQRGSTISFGTPTSGTGSSYSQSFGSSNQNTGSSSGATVTRSKKKLLLLVIGVILIILLFKMCSGSSSYVGSSEPSYSSSESLPVSTSSTTDTSGTSSEADKPYGDDWSSLLGGYGYNYNSSSNSYGYINSAVSSGWSMAKNTGVLNSSVAETARKKYTSLKGNGNDTVTVMVYMCGTDLESGSAMGSYDLQEMAKASLSDDVNIIVYTGGCKKWRTSGISNSVNQIYRVRSGSIERLESDMGNKTMTDPSTLSEFIKYCKTNFKASRNILILWDHGGGSLSGYGYDEKFSSSGSMTLSEIHSALKSGGVKFDFIGFDACLMATVETGLTVADYADYMIASEESEPGVGWYYTNWLSQLCSNTSVSTLELGKTIVDDFVSVCASQCAGQKTTLSLVDLAELSAVIPDALADFSTDVEESLDSEYSSISSARSSAREFASSSKIDQMDIADFANTIGTDSAKELVDAILGTIKYNGTSSNMTNAYGLSIYFPYRSLSYVSKAVSEYEKIGLSEEYISCIRSYASMQTGGQAVSGGASSPLYSLFGDYGSYYSGSGSSSSYSDYSDYYGYDSSSSYGSSSGYSSGYGSSYYGNSYSGSSSSYSSSDIYSILEALMGGSYRGVAGINDSNSSFLNKDIKLDAVSDYISEHSFDASRLVWQDDGEGYSIALPADQWALVSDVLLNVFYDDGEGYIDLGLDDYSVFTDAGALAGEYDGAWIGINGQIVAYYFESCVDDGETQLISGYVPVLLNGVRAELILEYKYSYADDSSSFYVAGVRNVYADNETETVAKSSVGGLEIVSSEDGDVVNYSEPVSCSEIVPGISAGDTIDFIFDYYTYDGMYQNTYIFGPQLTVGSELVVSDLYLPDITKANAAYRFTDLYQQTYWTTIIPTVQ